MLTTTGNTPGHDTYAPIASGRITDPAKATAFILGGNATFTLVSLASGTRYTFKVREAKRTKPGPGMFFASTLIGSDNESDYAYLGFLRAMHGSSVMMREFANVLIPGKKGKPDDVRFKALNWFLTALSERRMPPSVEFWHEGRCARCNRKLTDPVSIERGFGPECATK